jgi:hypothetical protein
MALQLVETEFLRPGAEEFDKALKATVDVLQRLDRLNAGTV